MPQGEIPLRRGDPTSWAVTSCGTLSAPVFLALVQQLVGVSDTVYAREGRLQWRGGCLAINAPA